MLLLQSHLFLYQSSEYRSKCCSLFCVSERRCQPVVKNLLNTNTMLLFLKKWIYIQLKERQYCWTCFMWRHFLTVNAAGPSVSGIIFNSGASFESCHRVGLPNRLNVSTLHAVYQPCSLMSFILCGHERSSGIKKEKQSSGGVLLQGSVRCGQL